HRVEGVDAVVDVDFMTAAAERLAEAIDIGGIPAEAVGPEERRDHAELHGRPPCRVPGASTSSASPVESDQANGRSAFLHRRVCRNPPSASHMAMYVTAPPSTPSRTWNRWSARQTGTIARDAKTGRAR